MLKKILCVLLSMVILVPIASIGTEATELSGEEFELAVPIDASSTAASIIVSSVSGKIGDTVSIDVVMENNPGIAAFRFYIDFDEEFLQPISVDKGEAVTYGNIYSNVSIDDISVLVTTWDNASDVSMNGVIFTMVFEIKDTSGLTDYPLTLTYNQVDVCNENFEDVYFEVVDGSITVDGFNVYSENSSSVETGNTLQLFVSLAETNSLRNDLVWESDNPDIASVDENGLVTGISAGNATITATITDSNCSATCIVQVLEPSKSLIGITINTFPDKTLYYAGESLDTSGLTLSLKYNDGSTEIVDSEFSCSPTLLDTEGVQTITVYYRDHTTEFPIRVIQPYYTVTWNVDNVEFVETYEYGDLIVLPDVPRKDGYKFLYWSPTVPKNMPAENLSFNAVFRKVYSDVKVKITTPESRNVNYGESITLYASATNLPDGGKIKWRIVEGSGVSLEPSSSGSYCVVTSKTTDDVIIEAYAVNSQGNVIVDETGNMFFDRERIHSEANLWLRIVYFFNNLFRVDNLVIKMFKDLFLFST